VRQDDPEAADLNVKEIALQKVARVGVGALYQQVVGSRKSDGPQCCLIQVGEHRYCDLTARHDLNADAGGPKRRVEFSYAAGDYRGVKRVVLSDVRSGHDRARAGGRSGARQLKARGQVDWAVVEAPKDVAVEIDHKFGSVDV